MINFESDGSMEKPKGQAWYFTFGGNHVTADGASLGNNFVVIEGTLESSREKLFEARGAKWSMQYNVNTFVQADPNGMWAIREVGLEDVWLPDEMR